MTNRSKGSSVSRKLCSLLLASPLATWASAARAEPATGAVYIDEVVLVTSWKSPAGGDSASIEIFKRLLRQHGYETNDCQENTEALRRRAEQTTADSELPGLKQDEKLIAAQVCRAPENAERYTAKLILREDPETKSRLALLHLIGYGRRSRDGGYRPKPGEVLAWEDILNRAIERAIGGYNDATAVQVSGPDTAAVGEEVTIDATGSWDLDGDPYELRWTVWTDGCVGQGPPQPHDERPCPAGTKVARVPVPNLAGPNDETRRFRVPMVGDYEIDVRAKIGARLEEPVRWHVRAEPRKNATFFVRMSYLRLPTDFLRTSGTSDPAVLLAVGYARRLLQRIGPFGWREEAHLGVSIESLQGTPTFGFTGTSAMALLGVEVFYRAMERNGRYGLATPLTLSIGGVSADRGARERAEWGWMAETMLGFYYPTGNNYVDRQTSFCTWVCPAYTIGPTISLMQNVSTSKFGLVGGASAVVALEF